MKRSTRALLAQETVAICAAGYYVASRGERVDIAEQLARAKKGTVLYSPEHSPTALDPKCVGATRFEARNETTFAELLKPPGPFAGSFAEVVFAVFDRSEEAQTYRAFAAHFDGGTVVKSGHTR